MEPFFLFHKFIDKEKSDIFISNRCYLGFSRNEKLYSYVHGNTLSKYVNMENLSDIKSDLVQNTFLKYSSKIKYKTTLMEIPIMRFSLQILLLKNKI